MSNRIRIKRVYDEPSADDGFRVLVDRLWPRGVAKASLPHELWCKDLAPSAELRRWFGHKPERWEAFRRDYTAELQSAPAQALMDEILSAAGRRPVTLLYGARDTEHNQAIVLAELMQGRGRHAG
ncbi:MAG TPA: DUF488 domain-containing protein [Castellaniella sp.]|nr:DUF488 domain-containing protein [Castellaniella sp.]